MPENRKAVLYRMVLPEHTCPYGVSAKEMLEAQGFEIEEHILSSRAEVDAFQTEHSVSTTPQVFIGGERIGGSAELETYLAENANA